MRLLALQAVKRMVDHLLDHGYKDQDHYFWCKNRPGAVLSLLYEDLYYVPERTEVSWAPVWKEPSL